MLGQPGHSAATVASVCSVTQHIVQRSGSVRRVNLLRTFSTRLQEGHVVDDLQIPKPRLVAERSKVVAIAPDLA